MINISWRQTKHALSTEKPIAEALEADYYAVVKLHDQEFHCVITHEAPSDWVANIVTLVVNTDDSTLRITSENTMETPTLAEAQYWVAQEINTILV